MASLLSGEVGSSVNVGLASNRLDTVENEPLIKLAYNNNHAKSSVWAISGQFNVLPFGEITAAMGG